MGGKETSKRASAAWRVSLKRAPIPVSLLLVGYPMDRQPSGFQQHRSAYLYAVGLAVAVALTVYVFALSY